MSALTSLTTREAAAAAPAAQDSLGSLLERLRSLAGVEFEWLAAPALPPRGSACAGVNVSGRLAGHLVAPASSCSPAALDTAAALAAAHLTREEEVASLADRVLEAWEQIHLGQKIAEALTPASDTQRLCESILDQAVRHLGARSATLRLRDEKGSEALCLASRAADAALAPGVGVESFEVPILRPRPAGEPEELGSLRLSMPRAGGAAAADIAMARALAAQAGLAVHQCRILENARRAERARREAEIAREVQSSLLPHQDPHLAGVEIAGACVPAAAAGGDAYGYLTGEPGAIGLLMADASGSGVPAAVAMVGVRALMRAEAARTSSPAAALRAANQQLSRDLQPSGLYATAFLARYEIAPRRLVYSGAGHPPILVWRSAEGRFERLEPGGLALGIFDTAVFEEGQTELAPGDLLLLFTDGVTDTRDAAGEVFTLERVCQTLMRHRRERPRTILYRLLEAVEAFRGGEPQRDDLTLMVLRPTKEGA